MLVLGVERGGCERSKVETRTKDVGPFVVDFEGMISGATFYGGCMCLRRTCRAQDKRREMRKRDSDLIDLGGVQLDVMAGPTQTVEACDVSKAIDQSRVSGTRGKGVWYGREERRCHTPHTIHCSHLISMHGVQYRWLLRRVVPVGEDLPAIQADLPMHFSTLIVSRYLDHLEAIFCRPSA